MFFNSSQVSNFYLYLWSKSNFFPLLTLLIGVIRASKPYNSNSENPASILYSAPTNFNSVANFGSS